MKYFSLFSGVGGFELAINNVYANKNDEWTVPPLSTDRDLPDSNRRVGGVEEQCGVCVGFSEIDKYAISVYQYHYKHKNYGDIQEIDWNTVPDFDLVVGGSPCQDLSVAGKQKGLSGARSGLFFEFVRCLKEKQPTNFIFENVKGMLSSSSGWDFARVQIEFSEAGYDVEWQVLNAKDFGVPQNRERIFVVGHLRGKSRPKVFPITTNYGEITQGNTEQNLVAVDRGILKPRTTSNALDANYYKGIDNHQARTGVISQKNTKIRRLTPLECERLMSWPDDWTKYGITGEISDTQRYKMCGNGVVSKVVEAIIERL